MPYTVYKIQDKQTGQIYYVGSTSMTLSRRLSSHKAQGPMAPVIQQIGIENIQILSLKENILDKDEAIKIEEQYTVNLKPLYNIQIGNMISKEIKLKASKSLSNKNNPRAQKIFCPTTGETFDTINDCITHFNISRSQFYKIINGTANQAKQQQKLEFKYIDMKLIQDDESSSCYIYVIREDDTPRYANITNRPIDTVLEWHKGKRTRLKDTLYNRLNQIDISHFSIEKLKDYTDLQQAQDELKILLHKLSKKYRLYNFKDENIMVSEETRYKQSLALSGKNNGNFGKHMSTETKEKMMKTMRENIDNGNNALVRRIICINTGEVFSSEQDACKKYNIPGSSLHAACNNIYKSCGVDENGEPLYWKYAICNSDRKYTVYQITLHNKLIYIGITCNSLLARLNRHYNDPTSAIAELAKQHSKTDFHISAIQEDLSVDEAIHMEADLIRKYQDVILNKAIYSENTR